MEIEIVPEPTPEERSAIVAALERLRDDSAVEPSAWWEAGTHELLEDGEEPS